MKKCLLFLFLSTFAFLSCETNEIETEESNIDLAKIENVKLLKGEEQKVAFGLLSNENKARLWQNKMDALLKSEKLSELQKNKVVELKKFIQPELYEYSTEKSIVLEVDLYDWSIKNKKHFTKAEVIDYFASVSGKLASQDNPPNCECSDFDDWCTGTSDCDKGSNNCDTRDSGCGFFWSRECDGMCQHDPS